MAGLFLVSSVKIVRQAAAERASLADHHPRAMVRWNVSAPFHPSLDCPPGDLAAAVCQPAGALSASAAQGALRFVELTAAERTTAPHDHSTTVCHSCAGHVCLEQHGTVDQASASPAVLAAVTITIEPWPAAEAWAHPPTAPPRAAFVHFISLPRAPPELS